MLAEKLYRLFEGYKAGYVTEKELQQSRKLYMDLLWLKVTRWLAGLVLVSPIKG